MAMKVKENTSENVRIAIIDTDEELRTELSRRINNTYYAEVVFALKSGRNAVEILCEQKPDVLIIDDLLPYKSGLEVIEEIRAQGLNPYIMMTMSVNNMILLNKATQLGVSEFIMKPYSPESILAKIRMYSSMAVSNNYFNSVIGNELRETVESYGNTNKAYLMKNINNRVVTRTAELLNMSGFNSGNNGYSYILHAVTIVIQSLGRNISITKEIYPSIVAEFNITSNIAECSIRKAIRSAWDEHTKSVNNPGSIFNDCIKRPTNKEFIYRVAYRIYDEITKI